MVVVFGVLLFVASAWAIEYVEEAPYSYGGAYAPGYKNYEPHDYHFDYAVSDPHTGDHKSQWEVKENGVVKGGYSLLEPDGTTRVVEYIADHDGFRAVVKKIGTAVHDIPHPVVAEVPAPVVAAPVPIAVEHEEPHVYLDHSNAYNGYYENYVPEVVQPAVSYVAAPKVVVQEPVPIYQQVYQQPYHPQPPVQVPYYGGHQVAEPHVKVEYHGFTGNDNDDSEYTKYDDGHGYVNDGQDVGYYYKEDGYNGHYEESRPQLVAVPYKFAEHYHQQPLPYQFIVKH